MGRTLYCAYYPKKCNDKEILPFLECYDSRLCELNGKHVPENFYKTCRELSEYDEDNDCYIFSDSAKLLEFAGRESTPSTLSDCICENYNDNYIFIIWIR